MKNQKANTSLNRQSFKNIIKWLHGGKTIAVGIDIGSRSMKVVVLEKKEDKIFLKNFAIANSPEDLIRVGTTGVITKDAAKVIEAVFEEAHIKVKKVNVSVPSFSSLVTTIEIPKLPKDEIDQAIRTEAPKYIPVDLSDVIYGWQIIEGESANSDERAVPESQAAKNGVMRILVVALMKSISLQYEKTFGECGLEIESLEIDSFSLVRGLIGERKECYLILDLGYRVSNILVVLGGNVLVNRTINVGSERITSLISQSMGVDLKRAEEYKITQTIERIFKNDSGVLTQNFGNLIAEIMKTKEIFSEHYPGIPIKALIMVGGGSLLKGVVEFIEKETKIKSGMGNPFADIIVPEKIKKEVISRAPLMAAAVGLARLGLDNNS